VGIAHHHYISIVLNVRSVGWVEVMDLMRESNHLVTRLNHRRKSL
jgi:hypothetical protein